MARGPKLVTSNDQPQTTAATQQLTLNAELMAPDTNVDYRNAFANLMHNHAHRFDSMLDVLRARIDGLEQTWRDEAQTIDTERKAADKHYQDTLHDLDARLSSASIRRDQQKSELLATIDKLETGRRATAAALDVLSEAGA
jgi:hypothetical protein